MAEIFEKVSFDRYNFRITTLSARKSKQMKTFKEIKICLYLPFLRLCVVVDGESYQCRKRIVSKSDHE